VRYDPMLSYSTEVFGCGSAASGTPSPKPGQESENPSSSLSIRGST
jgi:hypothetical protein